MAAIFASAMRRILNLSKYGQNAFTRPDDTLRTVAASESVSCGEPRSPAKLQTTAYCGKINDCSKDKMNGQAFLRVANGICRSPFSPKKIKTYVGCPTGNLPAAIAS